MKSHSRTPSKIHKVPFAQIRVPPAMVVQREFRPAHADYLAANMDLNKIGFPVVNKVGDIYWMIDGQHRYKALLQWDPSLIESTLECEVYTDLTDQEMAEKFIGVNDRKPVPPLDKFLISCTAGREREKSIRRIVETNGQKIARNHNEGISVVGALGKVFDQSGEVVLGQVVRTINLGFNGDPLGFDRSVVEGLGLVFNRFNGRTDEKTMGHRLRDLKQGARELLRKAEALRERTGNQKRHCIAAVVVDLYNHGAGPTNSKNRLPSWWKENA